MTIQDVLFKKHMIYSAEECRSLIFQMKVRINNVLCNNTKSPVKSGDIVRVGKIEILIKG